MQNKVIWSEGLFIRPQHFQQNDRYYTNELRTSTYQARPNNWGFFNLKIDEHLLSTGKIILESASGIMPDGTLFDITTREGFDWLRNNLMDDDVEFLQAKKEYTDDKNLDKFKLIQQGASITKGELFSYIDKLII
jgi:hypothetical protein